MLSLNSVPGRSVVLMLMLFLAIPVWANSGVLVDNLYCKPSQFELLRHGHKQPLQLQPYQWLQQGDQIRILSKQFQDKDCFVTLALGNGRFKRLTHQDTLNKPYQVKGNGTPPNTLERVMDVVTTWLGTLWKYDVHITEAGSKSKEANPPSLEMPLLPDDNSAQLMAKQRVLHLAWYGGTPPYQVTVCQKHTGEVFLDQTGIQNETVVSESKTWREGRYQVVVSDNAHNTIKREFTVVAEVPPLQSSEARAIEQSNLPEKNAKTLLAIWLTKQEGGIWGLEAYQQVADIPSDYYPALLVRQGLKDLGCKYLRCK